jgi:hypothetical protein
LVNLKIYDLLGNEVAVIINKDMSPGEYEVNFNASALASGIYIYQLKAGKFSSSQKMILLK